METYETPEPPKGSKNPLKGLGTRLKLHVIIPIVYAVIMVAVFIITQVWKGNM
jgi:hypothetical protein